MGEDREGYGYAWVGLLGVLVLVVVTGVCVAAYQQVFRSSVPIVLDAPRAGLLTDPGAAVKLNGVVVGRVTTVRTDGTRVILRLGLDPSLIERVPAGVRASIVPPTLFGAKYVKLVPVPATQPGSVPNRTPIEVGAVLGPATVTEEINGTFDQLVQTLHALPAAKLNAALSAVAGTLNGNGARLGHVIVSADDYLRGFNPSLPTLVTDLRPLTAASDNLADLTPDLITTLRNAGHTSDTLVQRHDQLADLLFSAIRIGGSGTRLLRDSQQGLVGAVHALRPTSALLAEFAPVMPCLFAGLVRNDRLLNATIGGPDPGNAQLGLNAALLVANRGMPAYHNYPNALPTVGTNEPPSCYGLPQVHSPVPFQRFDSSPMIYPGSRDETGLGQPPVGLVLPARPAPGGSRSSAGRRADGDQSNRGKSNGGSR